MTARSRFAATVLEKPVEEKMASTGRTGAMVMTYRNGIKALVKVRQQKMPDGQRQQRGLPVKTQPYREVAFYQLSKLLGWHDIIPETVLMQYQGNRASAQLYMPAKLLLDMEPYLKKNKDDDPQRWIAHLRRACRRVPTSDWLRLMIMDLIAASRDRHINNVGLRADLDQDRVQYHPIGWDNAASFGLTFERYHNVFHKFLFRYTLNLAPYWPKLEAITLDDLAAAIGSTVTAEGTRVQLLSDLEIEHAFLRLLWMLEFPYRLPWKIASKGSDSASTFPSYASWFAPLTPTSRTGRLFVSAGTEPVIVGRT